MSLTNQPAITTYYVVIKNLRNRSPILAPENGNKGIIPSFHLNTLNNMIIKRSHSLSLDFPSELKSKTVLYKHCLVLDYPMKQIFLSEVACICSRPFRDHGSISFP